MRTFVYLFIIGLGGYCAYQAFFQGSAERAYVEFRRIIAPSEIPANYQGRYVSDLVANAKYIREAGIDPFLAEKLYRYTGRETIEIGPTFIRSHIGPNNQTEPLKPIEAGWDYVDVEMSRPQLEQRIRVRITQDADGIWIATNFSGQAIRERFRRVR